MIAYMMDIQLLIDIGNSSASFATYSHPKWSLLTTFPTQCFQEKLPDLNLHQYKSIIVSSVVPSLNALFATYPQVHFACAKTIPFLKLEMDSPDEVGADRLVTALAAYKRFQRNTLIIDSGTAITFCIVSETGVYQGGAIVPGMAIASKSLHDYTAQIPEIFVSSCHKLEGKNTKEAVEIGLYYGYIDLINGLIHRYRQVHPNLYVVGTGTGNGLACLQPHINIDGYYPNLIFDGLSILADSQSKLNHPLNAD